MQSHESDGCQDDSKAFTENLEPAEPPIATPLYDSHIQYMYMKNQLFLMRI